MEQRPLRLGDIVDDYCPRERRITNHAIVAIVEEAIRQTRCATCDTEHVYKDGREPRRRKREPEAVLTGPAVAEPAARPAGTPRAVAGPDVEAVAPQIPATASGVNAGSASQAAPDEANAAATAADDGWPANRQLIRATLPRTDNDPPVPRPIPEFTMHQRPGRGQGFRYAQSWNGQGNGPTRGNGFRPGQSRSENGRGPVDGNGNGRPPGAGRSGRRRGRPKPPR